MTVVEAQPQPKTSPPGPAGSRRLYGLLAEYADDAQLLAAARRVRDGGYTATDAFTPFPLDDLPDALGWRKTRIAAAFLAGGVGGGTLGYLMMWYANVVSYTINVGGRPLNSWPAFIPITFEMTVLGAALTGAFALLVRCGLPRPNHPMFDVDGFDRSGVDRFFLLVEGRDPKFDERAVGDLLDGTEPIRVVAVERGTE